LVLVIYGLTAFVLLQLMPQPMRPVDYLLVGVAGTLISLVAVWLLLLRESPNRSEALYKRRLRKLDGTDVEGGTGNGE
jgi:uncharacterized membrane protein YeiB